MGSMRNHAVAVIAMALLALSTSSCAAFSFPAAGRLAGARSVSRLPSSAAPSLEEAAPAVAASAFSYDDIPRSGLNGLALEPKTFPTKPEALSVIPEHCFKKDTLRSMKYAATSVALTAACVAVGAKFIPMKVAAWPLWSLYALVTGTVSTGNWVIAHECGHNAFSDNKALQTAVGYILHSAMLVPYFSWQRSHAVHHAFTNSMESGETHVPPKFKPSGLDGFAPREWMQKILGKPIGSFLHAVMQLFTHLVVGWPAYLLWGATGSRGFTNHFLPWSDSLFPGAWKKKVWLSDIGVVGVAGALVAWGMKAGFGPVMALYGGPLLFVNMWLVLYTWLQHTDVDIPHMSKEDFSFVKGAFHSVDRPYGPIFDFLHHRIGSTHVAHHLESALPHYHAKEATEALKAAFPQHYLYDPTPVHAALWRVSKLCTAVEKRGDKWVFAQKRGDAAPKAAVA
jgi:fatty acid desaturase